MDPAKFNQIASGLESYVKIAAIIVGAVWAWRRFFREREACPLISFDISANFVGLHRNQWLVEVTARIENKGRVQHTLKDFTIEIRSLHAKDTLTDSDEEHRCQPIIPHQLKETSWVKHDSIVDPGITSKYPYVIALPEDARFISVKGQFLWGSENTLQKSSRLFAVPVRND